ncbi:unnamed protein product [Closterium sp. NIES-54]
MDLVRRGVLVVVQQPVEDDEAGGTDTSSSHRLPREIFILGTTHVSETAAEDAMRVVRSVQPQNVVVELCKSRAPIMYDDPVPDPSQPSAPNSDAMGAAASGAAAAPAPARDLFLMGGASLPQTLMRSIQLGGQSSLLLRLLLSFVSRRSAQAVGVQPGHEFHAAREAADAIGAQLVLGDRPIEITLRRAWKALSLLDRARLASALLQGGLKGGSLEQSELKGAFSRQRDSSNGHGMESLNMDRDVVGSGGVVEKDDAEGEEEVEFLSAVFQEVARQFPTLIGPLVHERDALPRQEASIYGGSAISDGSYQWFSLLIRTHHLLARYQESRPFPPLLLTNPLVPRFSVANTAVPNIAFATAAAPAPTAAGAALDTASWKLLESAFGFSFLYPSSYIVTINRKNDPADAPLTADGAQALAVVGNFVTFDTMSVIRYAFTPNPDKLAPLIQRILPNGNLSTSLVEDTVFPNQPIIELPLDLQKILSALASPAGLSFDVVTETCRGRIEEGKGGVGECVSVRGADLVQPIVRRHIGRILLSEAQVRVRLRFPPPSFTPTHPSSPHVFPTSPLQATSLRHHCIVHRGLMINEGHTSVMHSAPHPPLRPLLLLPLLPHSRLPLCHHCIVHRGTVDKNEGTAAMNSTLLSPHPTLLPYSSLSRLPICHHSIVHRGTAD